MRGPSLTQKHKTQHMCGWCVAGSCVLLRLAVLQRGAPWRGNAGRLCVVDMHAQVQQHMLFVVVV
jgi:hypothetical protein